MKRVRGNKSNSKRSNRTGSQQSNESIGISPKEDDNNNNKRKIEHFSVFKFFGLEKGSHDIIIFLFWCEKHNKIAIVNRQLSHLVWLPYTAIASENTWEESANNGVRFFLDKSLEEVDNIDGNQTLDEDLHNSAILPKYNCTAIHILRLQLPLEIFEIRITQFVHIFQTEGYECCQDTTNLQWVNVNDILNDNIKPLLGPEVKMFAAKITNRESRYIFEFNEDTALEFLNKPEKLTTSQSKLLIQANSTSDIVLSMYEDFVEFCFPSFYMTLDSFRLYLIKYGYDMNDSRFESLFRSISYNRKSYIDFFEFLVGIYCFEPGVENCEARRRMLFRYYDLDRQTSLNQLKIKTLLKDINPNAKPELIQTLVMELIQGESKTLKFEDFQNAIITGKLLGTEKLLRSPQRIVPQIVSDVKRHRLDRNRLNVSSIHKEERRNRGVCDKCRAQNYQYAMHCVTFQPDGRCGNPARTVNKANVDINFEASDPVSSVRYSVEYRFGIGSISNVFINLIRKRKAFHNIFVINSDEDPHMISKYIGNLCSCISTFFNIEEKLMKINGPAIVVGDMLGNLDSMMTIDKLLCQTVPIIQTMMVFMGNYIGNGINNVELICFLFSLKLQAPNKIILLRGSNENFKQSQNLLTECTFKYGEEAGMAIYHHIFNAIEKMPYAVVIDQSVICLHSGIPQQTTRLTLFETIPQSLKNVEECPLAYEVINNIPTDSEHAKVNEFTLAQLNSFLACNNLSHIIRSHANRDVLNNGYEFSFRNQCITICSNTSTPIVASLEHGRKMMARSEEVVDMPTTIRIVKLEATAKTSIKNFLP